MGGGSETDGTGCGRVTGSHWVLGGPGPLPEGHLLQSDIFIVFSRRSRGKRQQTGAEQLLKDKSKEGIRGSKFLGVTQHPITPEPPAQLAQTPVFLLH